jgi:hypothetical protein
MYFEDPHLAVQRATSTFEQDLARFKQAVFQRSGAERIKFIQEHAGHDLFFLSLIDSLA